MRLRFLSLWLVPWLTAAPVLFAKTPANVVEVISPSGGEQWHEGSTHVVSWTVMTGTVPDSVELRLIGSTMPDARGLILTIFRNENPGVWKWKDVQPSGKKYRMEVCAYYGGKAVKGTSMEPFAIVPRRSDRTETLQMTMAAPETGSAMQAGDR